MKFIEKLRVIERVDQLIRMKATGSARDLSGRLRISKTTVYDIIDVMKQMGADIGYCSSRRSYYYKMDKELAIGFVNSNRLSNRTINVSISDKKPAVSWM